MAKLAPVPFLSPLDLYASDTIAPGAEYIGAIQEAENGKWFRYGAAGASNLVVGNVLQSPARDTQFDDMAVPAAVVSGATGAISITNGTTVLSGSEFKGGILEVSVTPGLGEEYTIIDNGAAASGAALSVYLDRPIRTAWTTSTKVTLRKSPWNGMIQSPTTITGTTAGVAVYAIPTTAWGWVQVHGVGSVLSDATSIVVGSGVAPSTTVAGAVTLHVAGYQVIATAMRAAASGKTIPAFITVD